MTKEPETEDNTQVFDFKSRLDVSQFLILTQLHEKLTKQLRIRFSHFFWVDWNPIDADVLQILFVFEEKGIRVKLETPFRNKVLVCDRESIHENNAPFIFKAQNESVADVPQIATRYLRIQRCY